MPLDRFLSQYQNRTLTQIVVPGSHDAGLAAEHHGALGWVPRSWAVTQSESVGVQANRGSRFFDVRVMLTGGQLKAFHTPKKIWPGKSDLRSMGASGQGFSSMLDELAHFVRAHPTEFVFVRLSHLRDTKEVFEILQAWMAANDDVVYRGTGNLANKTVGELAGRLVMVIEERKLKEKNALAFYGEALPRIPSQADGFHCFYANKGTVLQAVTDGLCVCGEFSNSKDLEKIVSKQVRNFNHHDQHRNARAEMAHLYAVYWTSTGMGNIQERTRELNAARFKAMLRRMNLDLDDRPIAPLARISEWRDEILELGGLRRANALSGISMPNIILYDFVNDGISSQIVALNELVHGAVNH